MILFYNRRSLSTQHQFQPTCYLLRLLLLLFICFYCILLLLLLFLLCFFYTCVYWKASNKRANDSHRYTYKAAYIRPKKKNNNNNNNNVRWFYILFIVLQRRIDCPVWHLHESHTLTTYAAFVIWMCACVCIFLSAFFLISLSFTNEVTTHQKQNKKNTQKREFQPT